MCLVGRVGFPQLGMRIREILGGNSWSESTEEERHGVLFGKWCVVQCLGDEVCLSADL